MIMVVKSRTEPTESFQSVAMMLAIGPMGSIQCDGDTLRDPMEFATRALAPSGRDTRHVDKW